MSGVIVGFALIWGIIGIGYILGRFKVLGEGAQRVLSRFSFFVASPALLFGTISGANFEDVFGSPFWTISGSASIAALVAILVAVIQRRRFNPETVLGVMSSAYSNSNNLGLPIALYVLGSAAYAAPILIFQVAIYQPIFVIVIEIIRRQRSTSLRKMILGIVCNPLLIASISGIIIAAVDWTPPTVLLESLDTIGGAAVPSTLTAFGISLFGAKPFKDHTARLSVALASAIKLVIQPLAAFGLAVLVFRLEGTALFAAVVMAGLPTAQNVFVLATRYEAGEVATKDTILLTTALAVPMMLAVAALLA